MGSAFRLSPFSVISVALLSASSAGIVDSQSVKVADQGGARGDDAGKKIKGRKRHLLVDTLGLIVLPVGWC